MSVNFDEQLPMPTTVREFAAWLRAVAEHVDAIPDRPLTLREDDVEVGFYFDAAGNPTGLHFQVDSATTQPHSASRLAVEERRR